MTDLAEFLGATQTRVDAAPRGPWVWTASLAPAAHQLVTNGAALDIATCTENPDYPSTIAEFIAHARTDVPALVAMVRAVLDLHAPNYGRWGEYENDPRCSGCATHVTFTPWPCKTHRAIADAVPGTSPAAGSEPLEGKA